MAQLTGHGFYIVVTIHHAVDLHISTLVITQTT
jgi:hypothetical protein